MIQQLRSAWDRLSIYLPVVLMGLFALGTYWLVRSTPLLMSSKPVAEAGHDPDYFMRNFSVTSPIPTHLKLMACASVHLTQKVD